MLNQVVTSDPDLSGVPDSLRVLIVTALRKNPEQRPTSPKVLMTLIGRKDGLMSHDEATQVMREA